MAMISDFIKPSHIKGKKYYLYIHWRNDKEEPFYIGIGTLDKGKFYYRANCIKKRNIIWKRITNKTSHKVFIIEESDNKQDVLNREIQYIELFGLKKSKGILANLTEGGEGMKGCKIVWTTEMRTKIAEANRKRVITDVTRKRLAEALKKRGIINKKKNG